MIYMLCEYIPQAKEFKTFELANKAESNPHMWVDSLSDEHIEIHPNTLNKDVFINEINNLTKNTNDCIVTYVNQKVIIKRKKTNVLYAIISL